ncbi:hypothetical protein [Halocatena halophila]|uniref:hypothetical protein n=1 Tax=Halocatena halophila TaxID=2814576 RepID=UPI002ED698C8
MNVTVVVQRRRVIFEDRFHRWDMGQQTGDEGSTETEAYLERVLDRLRHSYDLTADRTVDGRTFDWYGHCRIEHQKSFLHPSISYGDHASLDHLFVQRRDGVEQSDLTEFAEVAHSIASDWIDPSPTHYETSFTFAVLVPELSPTVESFVSEFTDRTLLRYGLHGRYDVAFVVAAPSDQQMAASPEAEVARAFSFTELDPPEKPSGLRGRLRLLFG